MAVERSRGEGRPSALRNPGRDHETVSFAEPTTVLVLDHDKSGVTARDRGGCPLKTDASFVFSVLDRAGLSHAMAGDVGLVWPELAGQ